MAYDGSLKFDTKIDSSGFKNGISKIGSIAKAGMKTVVASIEAVSTALTAAGSNAIKVGSDFEAGMSEISSKFKSGAQKLGSLAKTGLKAMLNAVGAASTALVSAGGHAVKVGSDFEAGMSEVSAISGAVGEDLAALTDKAKEMGAKTKFSATESAEALKYMAMAGWDTKSMLDGLPGVMNLAAASGEDLATVSDIVTDAMTAFGLSADKSAHFADVLAKAASSSNTNVGLMGATFKYVAPLAGSMGYSIEDSALAIGLMANAGIKGEQAGTALRSTLTRLVKPPKDAAAALSALGVSAQNSDGSMKPLRETMTQLREKFAGLTDAEKASYAASIAGQEGMSGFLAIVNASDDDFDKLAASIDHADGAAQKMADTMQDNLQGQVTILKSSLEGLGIEIYDSMQEPLKNAAKEGIDYVNRLTEAFKSGGLQGAVEEAGGIFAELAAKAAEAAPGMVDAAVGFIQSFVSGIKKNRNQILEAAKNIVFALVDGIVSLLPGEIQKPVKETVETLKKSFNDGGLKKAIQTVGNILHNLGKVVTNIVKVILPPLSKAVDFLGKNFKIIVPLMTTAVVGIKAFKVVQTASGWFNKMTEAVLKTGAATSAEALATAASTDALTTKQIVVATCTGKIGLATTAQWLWNDAVRANPIGLAITAIAALAVGIGAYCLTLDESKERTERLNKSMETMTDGAAKFQEGISNAKSHLSDFDDTLFASSEEQQELQANMDEVQSGITTICRTATEERRGYTEAEIQQLDEYFARLNELNEQQFQIEQARMEAVQQQATTLAETHQGSLAEYQVTAQEWIATAEEQAEKEKALIEEQTTNELALLNQRYGEKATLDNDAYAEEYNSLMAQKQEKIDLVNQSVGEISAAYANGYAERLKESVNFDELEKQEVGKHHQSIVGENERYAQELANIEADISRDKNEKQALREEAEKTHQKNLQIIWDALTQGMTQEQQEQLGAYMALASDAELYGGKLSTNAQDTADDILKAWESMPEETRKIGKNMMEPLSDEMKKSEPTLYSKATEIGNGIIKRWKDIFHIKSPSKVMRKIFKQVMQGAEVGFDDETPKLYSQTSGIAYGILDRFGKARLDVSALVAKMKAAVAAETGKLSTSIMAQTTVVDNRIPVRETTAGSAPSGSYVAQVQVNLDGREIARGTAPFMGTQLQWEG